MTRILHTFKISWPVTLTLCGRRSSVDTSVPTWSKRVTCKSCLRALAAGKARRRRPRGRR